MGLSSQVGFKELPKTGEASNNMITISGGVVLLSILGLFGYKKRKENE
ncbi:LPXTG cell wall anchor domain-containing protein [Enterococcus gallinarum]